MTLENKNILVVGGIGGIGRAVARLAEQRRARVHIWDIREPGSTPESGFSRLDACSEEAVDQGFASLERQVLLPEILINAAGVFTQLRPFTELDAPGLFQVLQTNVGSCFLTCRALLRSKPENVSIVNISSALSQRPIPMAAAYSASKAAIDSLTRSIALEFAGRGVRANAINPGPVRGEMLESGLKDMAEWLSCQPGELEGRMLEAIPQSRLVSAEDVAAAALFVADDQASSITGQTINVCGGYQL